jgi:hypothetical protein
VLLTRCPSLNWLVERRVSDFIAKRARQGAGSEIAEVIREAARMEADADLKAPGLCFEGLASPSSSPVRNKDVDSVGATHRLRQEAANGSWAVC